MTEHCQYLSGFGNHFSTEALPDTLPRGQNSPQRVARGLYTEQLSGTSFLAPRSENQRSWLYRIQPSVVGGAFEPMATGRIESAPFDHVPVDPNQMRWDPVPIPDEPMDFIDGWITFAGNGDLLAQTGCAVHHYVANRSMDNRYFFDADGELLIVPQTGGLHFKTEFGRLEVAPGEICVIPRGVKFQVELLEDTARGYICENYGALLRLPNLGPIGANGLANPWDFQTPAAWFEDLSGHFELTAKFQGNLWVASLHRSPLDVVAWHGNYAPYKYDLSLFQTINTVSFDHPDPSIFTVLTSPSDTEGTSNVDFVIFPPRWMVAEHTFRPPYYHRNIMSEYMGLIHGQYDAKPEGFVPGGASLHNCMMPHGPDKMAFEQASRAELKPRYLGKTLAFMFESRYVFRPTRFAVETPLRQHGYRECWQDLEVQFNG